MSHGKEGQNASNYNDSCDIAKCKKKNKTIWIFVDAVDELIYSTTGSDYLISLLERAEILKIPVTLVVQDAVHIVTNQNAAIEFDYLLNKIRFFKFMTGDFAKGIVSVEGRSITLYPCMYPVKCPVIISKYVIILQKLAV